MKLGGRRKATHKAKGHKTTRKQGGSKATRKVGGRRHRHTKRCKHRKGKGKELKEKKSYRGGSTHRAPRLLKGGKKVQSGRIMASGVGPMFVGSDSVFGSAAINTGNIVANNLANLGDKTKHIGNKIGSTIRHLFK